jgi:hypothetical protein
MDNWDNYTRTQLEHRNWYSDNQQEKIGWNKVISGLFSIEWATIQERFKPSKLGDSWQSSVCSFMTIKAHQFWTERNNKMYEHNITNQINREEEEILSQVRNLYATQSDMNQFDALELFGIPIERRLTFTAATNKAWIIPTRRGAMKWCKMWLKKLKSRQPDIRQFFGKKKEKVNETMEMDESVGSREERSKEEGDEEEEELVLEKEKARDENHDQAGMLSTVCGYMSDDGFTIVQRKCRKKRAQGNEKSNGHRTKRLSKEPEPAKGSEGNEYHRKLFK